MEQEFRLYAVDTYEGGKKVRSRYVIDIEPLKDDDRIEQWHSIEDLAKDMVARSSHYCNAEIFTYGVPGRIEIEEPAAAADLYRPLNSSELEQLAIEASKIMEAKHAAEARAENDRT